MQALYTKIWYILAPAIFCTKCVLLIWHGRKEIIFERNRYDALSLKNTIEFGTADECYIKCGIVVVKYIVKFFIVHGRRTLRY